MIKLVKIVNKYGTAFMIHIKTSTNTVKFNSTLIIFPNSSI